MALSEKGLHHAKKFTLCAFCGSSPGINPSFAQAAEHLAHAMHARSWSLIYGGGTRGLMGILASSLVTLAGPTSVHGVIPRALLRTERGVIAPQESEYGQTTLVESMHERKAFMVREADAFVALPGGYGTMEELFEVITWNQLGIHARPVIVFNVEGYFDELIGWIEKAAQEGFVAEGQTAILKVANTATEVVELVKEYRPAEGRHLLDWEMKECAV